MAEVMSEAPAAAPEVPSGPTPFEQKAPYYAKRIQLFEVGRCRLAHVYPRMTPRLVSALEA